MNDLILWRSPWPLVVIISAYLYFVNGFGQRLMAKRKAFELTKVINVYNIIQMVANAYIFWLACYYPIRQENFRLFCIPESDYSFVGNKILRGSHFFFLLKVLDLMDTIFFVLRKKNNQVTFLHIYHHAGMVVGGYIYSRIYAGGGFATAICKVTNYFLILHIIK